MILKLFGAVLIISATTLCGYRAGNDLQQYAEDLQSLKHLLLMLKSEIRYTKSPLPEAFGRIARRIGTPYDIWLMQLSRMLARKDQGNFASVWKRSVERYITESRLKKEDFEELKAFGRYMGYQDEEMQIGSIDLYLTRLDEKIAAERETLAQKKRLCHCLGVMSGMFLTVILL